jgi:hypothetical protein
VEGRSRLRPPSASANGFTVSPTELREALSSLDKAAIQFELSEMHDASEVRYPGPSLMVQFAPCLKMSFSARWDVVYWGLAAIKAVHVLDVYYTVYPRDLEAAWAA